jgi:hypothetical protein
MGAALDPTSGLLYVIDVACGLHTVETAGGTGASTGHTLNATIAGQPIVRCDAMAIGANGVGYASVQIDSTYESYFVTFDPATGATTPVGPIMSAYYDWMAIDPVTGTLYGQNDISGDVYSMDPESGIETNISAFDTYSYGLVIANDGTFYSNTWSALATGTISPWTGTSVGPFGGTLASGSNAFFTSTNFFPTPTTDPTDPADPTAALASTGPDAGVTLLLSISSMIALLAAGALLVAARQRKAVA